MAQHVWEAYRKIVAGRDGYRCVYCRVPTAATIEHIVARSQAGGSAADNLAIACPWCNTHKGNRSRDEFLAAGLHKVIPPEELGNDIWEMLRAHFGIDERTVTVSTKSPTAKLDVRDGTVVIRVRAGSRDEWRQMKLGGSDDNRVVKAAYDFLAKHYTPPKPQRPRPPKGAFDKRKR